MKSKMKNYQILFSNIIHQHLIKMLNIHQNQMKLIIHMIMEI